jgi:ADP-ribose pyrophosphatase YjhB (NUDIX family)
MDDRTRKATPSIAEARAARPVPARRTVHAFSAGGLVLRGQPNSREILLVGRDQHHRSGRLWALPKGTPVPGESPQQTALREVREETGVEVAITGYAGVITYTFMEQGVRYRKRVAYYTMIAIGGDPSLHDHEYDYVSWFDADQALRAMRYPNEIDLVRRVLAPHDMVAVDTPRRR